ncbi:MAG: ketopantoate reductase family protein [Mogibacterium sp.]|nr:ketopantoate reductase family protein [Mogibacterium sp.]
MQDKYITLIGLGAVGGPLAHKLWNQYGEDFALLSSEDFLWTLENLYINEEKFHPNIFSKPEQLKKKNGIVFICVKNYHVSRIAEFLRPMIDDDTIIVPLQNGVYSYDYFTETFPNNFVLEGFAQGPNTQIMKNCYVYQKPGVFHIGTSDLSKKEFGLKAYEIMKNAGVDCYYDDNIKHEVWKKLMLNTAGNAITALTGIDYCMFDKSPEVQDLCRRTMKEYATVAVCKGLELTDKDIEDIMRYYLSFTVSKHTSMLEDVINKRRTENEYIAGYIYKLAEENGIEVPNIKMLYELMKVKEQVYLEKI